MNLDNYALNPTCTEPVGIGKSLNERWYVYFNYTHNGARKSYRKYTGLNNKKHDIHQRRKALADAINNLDILLKTKKFDTTTQTFIKTVSEQVLVNDLIEDYLKFKKATISHYTYLNYNSLFKRFKLSTKGLTLSQIDQQFLKDFLKKTPAKPQSKRSYRTYISGFFNWLKDEKDINIINPTHGLRLERNEPVERHKIYSKEEIKAIIDYCDSNGHIILKTIIYLVYGAQMRISEILRMQIEDINLDYNKIVLPKGKGKIKNREKIVLLDEPLKVYLLNLGFDFKHKDNQKLYFIGQKRAYDKAKFFGRYPVSKNTIDTRFKQLKKDLNISTHKTLYSFKHTGNVNLLLSGADLIELMYKNGHKKISQTETYARQLIEQVPETKYIRKSRDDLDFK